MWNAWNDTIVYTVKWVVWVVVNSTGSVLLHLTDWIYMLYEYVDNLIKLCMDVKMHSTDMIWCFWMVLLQILEQQSNFGDILECVDRVERTSRIVSFALYMCGSALLYWHYCARLVVAQQELYAHWWRCMHVVIFTVRVHTHAHVCVPDFMSLWSWCACIIVCVAWVGVIRMAILILYLLCMCGMPGMARTTQWNELLEWL